jgi:LacI family transcriptional regulator
MVQLHRREPRPLRTMAQSRDGTPAVLPTMRDVARAAGVHQTTVSLALRNDPGVTPRTRARVRAAAQRLGYRPDPLLAAFNEHRLALHPTRSSSLVAYIADGEAHDRAHAGQFLDQLWNGARAAADERGLALERFLVGRGHLSVPHLKRILRARNIAGLVLVAFDPPQQIDLDWAGFCAVRIESRHLKAKLDLVSADQRYSVRLAVRKLRALGYRRIGLAVADQDEERLEAAHTAGFLVEEAELPGVDRVPPLIFPAADGPEPFLRAWIEQHAVEAVISNWVSGAEHLRGAGFAVPDQVAFACADVPPDNSELAGVVENHALVARTAIEHLAILLQTHRRGESPSYAVTYVPGFWRDGPTAPKRHSAAAAGRRG